MKPHHELAVNIVDSRAIVRVDIGFQKGALLESLQIGPMPLWLTRKLLTVAHISQDMTAARRLSSGPRAAGSPLGVRLVSWGCYC